MSAVTTPATPATPEQLRVARKAVISSSIGATLEWFDIVVYATFATTIAVVFYPDSDPLFALILTFATFTTTYLIRPLGGLILGGYADRHGRKNALTLTLLLMMVGTLIMATAPAVPFWGAIVILISRLVQGFSAGGEFGTATTFLVETAPHRKNFYGSWQIASQGAAILLASAFGYALTTSLNEDDLMAWGWRVPFFIGLLVGPVGLWIRARMSETDEFLDRAEKNHSPIKMMVTRHSGRVLAGAASVGVATLSVYMILYMPTFAVTNLGLSPLSALLGGVVAGAIALVGSPLVGRLADRVGPARVMTWTAVAALVLAWPLFQLVINFPTMPVLVSVIAVLGCIMTFYFAPLPGLMSSLFPVEIRGTGMSMAYNLGVTILGSIAPLVLTWLLGLTGQLAAPSYYYIVVSIISLAGLYFVRTRYGQR